MAAYARKYRKKNPVANEKHRERNRRWRERNPEKYHAQLDRANAAYKANPHKHRDVLLRLKYGITLEQFRALIDKQKGKCDVCGEPFGKTLGTIPVVDHDHADGKIRGILHSNCNKAIGLLMDSPENCMKAAKYLMKYAQLKLFMES